MKKSFLTLSFLILFSANIYSQIPHQEWVQSGPTGVSATFLTTDAAGNVYIAGPVRPSDAPDFTFLYKYSSTGAVLYANSVDTPCYMVSAFKDAADNIYIDGNNSLWAPPNSTLIKYNSSGVKQWRLTETILPNDGLGQMVGDNSGNPCLLRRLNGVQQMVKYNSAGTPQLVFNIPDTEAVGIFAIDAQNNFITAGIRSLSGNIYYLYVVKYSSAAARLWKISYYPAGGSISISKIFALSSGNIYIGATVSQLANNPDYCVLKLNSGGQLQWTSFFDGCTTTDYINDMKMDSSENSYITGGSGTVKFNSSGALQWSETTSPMASIALDPSGNIYAAGSGTIGSLSGMKTIRINPAGVIQWSIVYPNTPPSTAWANAVALDTSGNVFITGISGYTPMPGYHGVSTTIKYSQLNGIKNISSEIPKGFSLSQNYPNPFNPSTKFKIDIAKSSFAKVTVFDVLGREVATLVNQQLQPGVYEMNWDASNFPSGVYFYTLTTGDFEETKKMLLIK